MEHVLGTEEFILRISTEVFETDIKYPCNTSLKVAVESCGFCGKAVMDIDIKEFEAAICAKFGSAAMQSGIN